MSDADPKPVQYNAMGPLPDPEAIYNRLALEVKQEHVREMVEEEMDKLMALIYMPWAIARLFGEDVLHKVFPQSAGVAGVDTEADDECLKA